MTELLIALATIVGTAGIIIGVWSIIDTRNRYYDEYVTRRKKNARD